ncbi:hypothetical protein [Kordia jejudonensis]|uniref:hypothetical protein n=1 Tax=Kordia jejudonensis TaxID=1348245 RepID=UPI000629C7D7|nr:hypothetical protein [Kordia jejudonensis]
MNALIDIAYSIKSFLSDEWKADYGAFLQNEHVSLLSRNAYALYRNDFSKIHGKPHFEEEIIPDMKETFSIFKTQFHILKKHNFEWNVITRKAFATAVEQTPFAHILILTGQRLTSASIQDERAIPPLRKDLIKSSFKPHNNQISKAVRAWEKHAQRSSDNFWGTIKGSTQEKEENVQKLIKYMLKHKTWWNVFTHYKHDIVYEIRIASGHGIRWKKDTLELIGFLEPFEDYHH